MSTKSPDRTVHVAVNQDVTCCILLTNLNDLSIPCAYKDLPLKNQARGHRVTYRHWSNLGSHIIYEKKLIDPS